MQGLPSGDHDEKTQRYETDREKFVKHLRKHPEYAEKYQLLKARKVTPWKIVSPAARLEIVDVFMSNTNRADEDEDFQFVGPECAYLYNLQEDGHLSAHKVSHSGYELAFNGRSPHEFVGRLFSDGDDPWYFYVQPSLFYQPWRRKSRPSLLRAFIRATSDAKMDQSEHAPEAQLVNKPTVVTLTLLSEILHDSFKALPRTELGKCQLVCREWKSTITTSHLLSLRPLTRVSENQGNLIVSHNVTDVDGRVREWIAARFPAGPSANSECTCDQPCCGLLARYLRNSFIESLRLPRLRWVNDMFGTLSQANVTVKHLELTGSYESADSIMTSDDVSRIIHTANAVLSVREYTFYADDGGAGTGREVRPPLDPRVLEDPALRNAASLTLDLTRPNLLQKVEYQAELRRCCADFIFSASGCGKLVLRLGRTAWSPVDASHVIEQFETSADVSRMVSWVEYRLLTVQRAFEQPPTLIPEHRSVTADESMPHVLFDVYYVYNACLKEYLTVAVASHAIIVRSGRVEYNSAVS